MADNVIESDNFIQATAVFLETLNAKLAPMRALSTDFSPDEGEKGDTVKVRVIGAAEPAEAKTPGAYNVQPFNQSKKSVVVDQHDYVSMGVSDKELLIMRDLDIEAHFALKAEELAKKIVSHALSLATIDNFGAAVHTAGSVGFSMDDIIAIGEVCDDANWPEAMRSLILNGAYHSQLRRDPVFQNAAAFGSDEVIRTGRIPNIDTFNSVYKVGSVPDNGIGVRGMAVRPDAIISAGRYLAPNDSTGVVLAEKLTDENSGLTVGFRRFYDKDIQTEVTVLEILHGAAVGKADSLKLITQA